MRHLHVVAPERMILWLRAVRCPCCRSLAEPGNAPQACILEAEVRSHQKKSVSHHFDVCFSVYFIEE